MFRQRLKGGHRVGANSNISTSQNDLHNPPLISQVSSQNWYSNAPYSSNVQEPWNVNPSISNTSEYQHYSNRAQTPQVTDHYGSQIHNESGSQNQGQDAWNWGTDDSWNDWGNGDTVYINSNNNNIPTTRCEKPSFNFNEDFSSFSTQSAAEIENSSEFGNNNPIYCKEETSSSKVDKICEKAPSINKNDENKDVFRNTHGNDTISMVVQDSEDTVTMLHHPTEENVDKLKVNNASDEAQSSRIQSFFTAARKNSDVNSPDDHSSSNTEIPDQGIYSASRNFSCSASVLQDEKSDSFKMIDQRLDNECNSDSFKMIDQRLDNECNSDNSVVLNDLLPNKVKTDERIPLINQSQLDTVKPGSIAESLMTLQDASPSCQNHNSLQNNAEATNETSAQVSSWDDEWGDGWETKPLSCQGSESSLEQSETNVEISYPSITLNQYSTKSSNINDTFEFAVNESTHDIYGKNSDVSINQTPEVSNIQVLDQELQGIFSGPSEAALVVGSDVQDTPMSSTFSYKEKLDTLNVDNSTNSSVTNEDNEKVFVDRLKMDSVSEVNTDKEKDLDGKPQMDNVSVVNTETDFEGNSDVVIQEPVSFTSEALSGHLTTDIRDIRVSNSLPRDCENNVTDAKATYTIDDLSAENAEERLVSFKIAQSVSGPSGNIPNLQARKGSPFQPPSFKRTLVAHHLQDPNININSYSFSCLNNNSYSDIGKQENALLDSQPLESNVKLHVAHKPLQRQNLGEPELNKPLLSEREIPTSSYFENQILPAHFSNMQTKLEQPKIRTLETMNDTPTSPSVLDLSQLSMKKERDTASPPSFKRMVPGESTKGESAASMAYQIPIIVPAMPSGRVVTGNDNPQPIPSSRIKQEPSEIRAPPDGPDTGVLLDESHGVIPPIRSETIGSEGHYSRPPINNRPDDDDSDSQREKQKDGKREYYSDRHSERKRNEASFYSRDSPHRGKSQGDLDYDPYYSERHYGRRALRSEDYDDDEDDGDERKYLDDMKERRRKAYRDELERYGERERNYGREKRRHRDRETRYLHEDEDFYEDHPSDRSRPSSRSSSFGNMDSETGPGSHLDDYYDPHYPKPRDKPREKGYRDPYRGGDYAPYRKREGKEKDPYGKGGFYPYGDRYGSREMYDPHSYYYYYQHYQKYLEQHPYYREYYRQYYGRYGYPSGDPLVDDKTSTRSGRSSVNDEIKKASLSSQFHQDFVDQSSVSAYESSLYPDQYSYACKSYISGDGSRVPSVADDSGTESKQRLSPHLYTGPHLKASFTSGGRFLLVLPNDPKEGEKATIQLRNVQKVLAVDGECDVRIKKLASYPGPLTINDTHKDIVLRFCEEKSFQALENATLFDRESVVLMWDYLSLLVKQNGKVSGADLASLLIRGKSRLTNSSSASSLNDKRISSVENFCSENNNANIQIRSDKSELLKNFTELLCLGRKKEAIDYAIKEELWGYAMVLAAKMDSMTHARVISAFMQSIPSNDVLHTLIQHLSGKKPEVTRNYSSEKWGDWRLHLAMMVSNPTGNLQKDRSSIIALGDTLVGKQRYHAAHICYLAADAEWGCYSDKDSKLVLLGSSPHQPFQLFASDDAIQCTEVFEFSKCLDSNNPTLLNFQSYKLIYGYRLAEFGFPNEALKYCQVITDSVIKQPAAFHLDFIAKIFELASQLKYHDVHYQMGEGELSEMSDPKWLQTLSNLLQTLQYQANEEFLKSLESESGNFQNDANVVASEHENLLSSRRSSEGNVNQTQESSYSTHLPSDPTDQGHYVEASQTTDNQENEMPKPNICTVKQENHFTNEDYLYQRMNSNSSVASTPSSNAYSFTPTAVSSHNNYQQPQITKPIEMQQQVQHHNQQQQVQHHNQHPHHQNMHHENYALPVQQDQIPLQQIHQPTLQEEVIEHRAPTSVSHYSHPQSDQVFSHENLKNIPQLNGRENSLQHVPQENSMTSPELTSEELEYWKMMTGKGDNPSNMSEDSVDNALKQEDSNLQQAQDQPQQHQQQKQLSGETQFEKDEDQKSSSFLGSLFGGWRKSSNQAKLPDDKNPSIVWDENKKKWVNKDGDSADEVAPPPPPSAPIGQPPPIIRGSLKKSRYVDPVGEKGRTKVINNVMPSPIPNMGAIPPLKPVPVNEQPMPTSFEPQRYPETQDMPNTSPPIQTQGPPEMGDDQVNSIPMMNPVESQPQPLFFNPAQFQAPQNATAKPPRRAGPAKRSYNPQR